MIPTHDFPNGKFNDISIVFLSFFPFFSQSSLKYTFTNYVTLANPFPLFIVINFICKQAAPKAKKAAPKKAAAKKVFRCRPWLFFFPFFHSMMLIMPFMMRIELLCLLMWWMLVVSVVYFSKISKMYICLFFVLFRFILSFLLPSDCCPQEGRRPQEGQGRTKAQGCQESRCSQEG